MSASIQRRDAVAQILKARGDALVVTGLGYICGLQMPSSSTPLSPITPGLGNKGYSQLQPQPFNLSTP